MNVQETKSGYGSHNRLSAFGVIGTIDMDKYSKYNSDNSHNRLSAFGVIGTGSTSPDCRRP